MFLSLNMLFLKIKNNMQKILLIFISIGIISVSNAQVKKDSAILDNNFRFKDGLYLNFEQVKENSPIPPGNIIAQGDKTTIEFWKTLFDNEAIAYIDSNGQKQFVFSDDAFGFSYKGKLYIHLNNSFAQIPVLGAIFHFTIAYNVQDPYYFYHSFDPYYVDDGYNSHIEVSQYIIDFQTGQIYEYNIKTIDQIFSRDKNLYEKWSNLSRRKKKKLIFVYLQEYNKNNPVKIPVK